jgi:hypothetical protein
MITAMLVTLSTELRGVTPSSPADQTLLVNSAAVIMHGWPPARPLPVIMHGWPPARLLR